ncbi:hypothetical protein PoB_002166000 [Plakobranchus ocellatus]|uniref:Uncharacterized protein n=1 Tax=Plakobranchus ocellatus TaxID=259542 RepID=A0AAV3ZKT1_9GAST|nr:hypothetical protein PoB_002166000 [Plakobranchus ocellatus]
MRWILEEAPFLQDGTCDIHAHIPDIRRLSTVVPSVTKSASKFDRCANLTEQEKSQAVTEVEQHLLKVTKEGSYLRSILEATRRELPQDFRLGKHAACTFQGTAHCSLILLNSFSILQTFFNQGQSTTKCLANVACLG